jgi:hypothetical protein
VAFLAGARDIIKVSAVHAAGWLLSVASIAVVVRVLASSPQNNNNKRDSKRDDDQAAPAAAAAKPAVASSPSQAAVHRAAVRSAWTSLTCAR